MDDSQRNGRTEVGEVGRNDEQPNAEDVRSSWRMIAHLFSNVHVPKEGMMLRFLLVVYIFSSKLTMRVEMLPSHLHDAKVSRCIGD